MSTQPFHDGELEAQRRAGEAARGRLNGRAISGEIVRGALPFIAEQPFFLAATLDGAGRPWPWLVAGPPGFAQAPSAREVRVRGAALFPDELRLHLALDGRIGMLFFEPETRRRLRVNGSARLTEGGLDVAVAQAFPNCPKYIQRRVLAARAPQASPTRSSRGQGRAPGLAERLARADTFFVASRGPDGRLDVSHRGGPAGFVTLAGDALLVPDYPGNSMFNTFGNLLREPRAGLLFPDFERGDLLHMTGRAQVDFAEPAPGAAELATGRSWTFAAEHWRLDEAVLPFHLVRLP